MTKPQLYLGETGIYKQYDDIGWLHIGSKAVASSQTGAEAPETSKSTATVDGAEQIPDKSIHFLARTGDQWSEVHNGVESTPFDGLESITIGNKYPGPIQSLSHEGRPDLPNAYIDGSNRFFYRAKVGEKDAIVHQGQQSTSVEGLQTVWLFNDGQLMAFNNILPEGQQVYAAGALSEVYPKITPPLYQQYSQSINFVATLSAPENSELSTAKWQGFNSPESLESWLEEEEIEASDDVFKRFYCAPQYSAHRLSMVCFSGV